MRGELVYGQLYLNRIHGHLYEAAVLLKLTLASFEAFLYQRRIRCKYETKLLFVDKRHASEDKAESLLRVLVSAVCYNRMDAR